MSARPPYRGLAAFEDTDLDALYFFGRERDSEIVTANLIASRLTVLYGPSGVGKSSLLLASVVRALRNLPEAPLVVAFSQWIGDPEQALAEAAAQSAGIAPGGLVDVVARAQSGRDVYLILDQAEQYFTVHGSGTTGFDHALAELVDGAYRVNVLLSLREDTLASLDPLKAVIPALFGNVLRLDRLDRAAGRAAIVKPVARWNELEGETVFVEEELVDQVLDGVGVGRIELGSTAQGPAGGNGRPGGIEAPYLQLVMQRLWEVERSQGSTTLRAETLVALGGAGQVVADHLDRAIEALSPTQRDIAALLFEHLVTPSGLKIAHEPSDLATFARCTEDEVRGVVGILAEHRIVRADKSGRWEIFHDVLAGAVLGWKSRYEAERAVLRARAEARRRHRRLAFLTLGALAALAAATGLAAFAFSQRHQAEDQARAARAGQLVASALSLLETDPELGVAFAAEGARLKATPRAADALRGALDASRIRGVIDTGHPVVGLDLHPQSAEALVAGSDGWVRMLELPSGRRVWGHPLDGHAAAFTQNGRQVVIVSRGRLRVVDSETGKDVRRPITISVAGSVTAVVPDPAGTKAIVVLDKPRAPVFSLVTGERIGRVKHAVGVTDAAFARSGVVGSGGRDHVARLWSPTTWQELGKPLSGHVGQVLAVAFDGRARRIATASTDQTARVWRAGNGALLAVLLGHTGYVSDVGFGKDGVVITASGDGTARTWRANGSPAHVLLGHDGAVLAAEYASDGSVVTGGADGTIRIWDPGTTIDLLPASGVAPPPDPARRATSPDGRIVASVDGATVRLVGPGGRFRLAGHTDLVNAIAFSPDGTRLVSAGRDHDVVVWDVVTGKQLYRLDEAQSASVADARFSPDGRWLVTAGPIAARLWSAGTGRSIAFLYGPKSSIRAAAFGPDSRAIVTGEEDGTVRRYVCDLCGDLDELLTVADARLRRTGRRVRPEDRAQSLG